MSHFCKKLISLTKSRLINLKTSGRINDFGLLGPVSLHAGFFVIFSPNFSGKIIRFLVDSDARILGLSN